MLTFDDGPWPVNTPSVLKSLADQCTTGIFFSIGKHATKHFRASGHPVIEDYYPGEGWGWCYVDELMIDLDGDVTPHPPGWAW